MKTDGTKNLAYCHNVLPPTWLFEAKSIILPQPKKFAAKTLSLFYMDLIRLGLECQSHRLTVEDPATVEYITRYIAGLQQKYTQSGGVRPFGLSTLIVGFDPYTSVPSLYQTDPSRTFSAWKANATGRNSNSMREFLEKNYKETYGAETRKLTIRALLEVAVMKKEGLRQLEEEEIDAIVAEIEEEKAAAEAAKKAPARDS
ncbi:proteasome endopeptidase complex [Ranunculus cassubicifolius]